jgi:hypothetical protein
MGIDRLDVDGASKEGTASIQFRTKMTVIGSNRQEHTPE